MLVAEGLRERWEDADGFSRIDADGVSSVKGSVPRDRTTQPTASEAGGVDG